MRDLDRPLRTLLEETPWVQTLPVPSRERIFLDAYETHFQQGTLVARRGDTASAWIGVAEGLLKISAIHRNGKTVMFTGVPEGCWIGEGSILKREPRRYDIEASQPSRVINIPASTFRWLLDTSFEFNQVIMTMLNERLGQFIGIVEIDRLTDPVARVARTIATLFNPVLYPCVSPMVNLSQSELGEFVGLSRQSVAHALKRLETEGLISIEYKRVVVHKLQALAHYEERDS